MDKRLFIILVIICIITHVIRSVYEILKHNKKLKPNRLTFVIVFTNMMVLWMSWFVLCTIDIYTIHLAGIIKAVGISLAGIGLIIFLIALSTIKTLESYEGSLITKGIYSKVRHPMYLGFILWLIGFPVFNGALFSFLLGLIFIANVLFWQYLEEKELDIRFPSYPEYRKRTLF